MKKSILLSLLITASSTLLAQNSEDIIGVWLNEEGDAQIEVFKEKDHYFGKIVWLEIAKDENGEWMLDVKNPDEKLKTRKKLGMTVMQNLVWDANEKEWNNGKIYDAREGDTYSLYAKTDGMDILNLRGYIGFALFGKTTSWTRSLLK
tara:strand:- start:77 stop:520 length:444 start_codon:yes stop_codon:yes gene_type:complete